ncbi:hypothetical protein EMIT051CA3_21132 [Pseudomonas chlororaphis]
MMLRGSRWRGCGTLNVCRGDVDAAGDLSREKKVSALLTLSEGLLIQPATSAGLSPIQEARANGLRTLSSRWSMWSRKSHSLPGVMHCTGECIVG